MVRIWLGALCAVLMAAVAADAAAPSSTVRTKSGSVSGVVAGQMVSWKGIPYAAPPVGDLRWQPPQAAVKWAGVRVADKIGPACPQPERTDGGGAGPPPSQSEDCLTLNISAPVGAKKAPVMVWIHGGAFRLGYGGAPIYDGAEFAKNGVILVTINYRIGLLGFFAHPKLTEAAKAGEPLGNYGLMDQLAALKWVQDNIAAFGGDPKNVTAFGESAGGSSLIYLLANPHAKNLFSKAIIESGGGLQRPVALAENEQRGVASAANIGLGASATLAEMRAKPAKDWVTAQGALAGGLAFGPFIDGRLVTEAPWEAYRDKRAMDVPLIIGANSNEASVLSTLGVPTAALATAVGSRMTALRPLYGNVAPDEFTRQAMGDLVFVAQSRWIAGATASGAPSYLYYFPYVVAARRAALPGANHGSEIPFVFKTWQNTPVLASVMTEQDKAMSAMMSACWISFAKTGAPSCAPAPAWPRYDPASDLQMEFSTAVAVMKPDRAAAFDLLTSEFPQHR